MSSQVMPLLQLCALNNKDVDEIKYFENRCPVGLFNFFCNEIFLMLLLPTHLALVQIIEDRKHVLV